MSGIMINLDFSIPSKPKKILRGQATKNNSLSFKSCQSQRTQNSQSNKVLNLDYANSPKRQVHGNAKHQKFLQRRKYLEQRAHRQNNKEGRPYASFFRERVTGAMSRPPASTSSSSSLTVSVSSKGSTQQSEQKVTIGHSATRYGESTADVSNMSSFNGNPSKYVAIDCEMVGTGPKGHCSELARCSVVSYNGDVMYDKFIKPTQPVSDFRTRWSGIRWHHLVRAISFPQAKTEILKLLKGKVVVGHSVQNDFKVLSYIHPAPLTRDIAKISLLNKKAGFPENQAASLKRLTKALLNRDIQNGYGHSSVEDAKATMELYKLVEAEWERILASTAGKSCASS